MSAKDPAERRAIASLAADFSWANTPDRAARTAPARQALADRWLRQVLERHPDVDEKTAAQMAESLKRAHYKQLARRSAAVRSARSRRGGGHRDAA